MNVIVSPAELAHFRCFTSCRGTGRACYALHVSPNWRITFRWDEAGPYEIDLEDYHD